MVMEYCKVLIVGDGDLSNSVHLLSQYCGSCLTSTVFLSKKDLVKVYGEGNILIMFIYLYSVSSYNMGGGGV